MDTRDLLNDINALIDETFSEIEELKKSKFAAAEIKLEGPGSDLAGKPTDGNLETKKEDDEEDEDGEDEEGEETAEKADSEIGMPVAKKDDDKTGEPPAKPTAKSDDEHKVHADIKAAESNLDSKASTGELDATDLDTLRGKGLKEAKKPMKKEDEEEEDDEDEKQEMKKSIQAQETLMKSYVDQKIGEVESKINNIAAMLEKIANQPVERKGVPAGVVPLRKSEEGVETLSKSEVADKLLTLKKSGANISTDDIVRVETGSANDRLAIIKKYSLK